MFMSIELALVFILFQINKISTSTNPLLTNWVECTGVKYNGSYTDVTSISYTSLYAFISSNSLPDYTIGPWKANPNYASAQSFTVKIPMSPSENTGTKTSTPLGTIGLWTNGVAIFNAKNGYSYNSLGVWNENAYYLEGISFDDCGGHPSGKNLYHNHVNPTCLYTSTDSTTHSPIIGWAFDGYPIYGPFGYSSANDSTSSISRILPSYSLRSITSRTSLWNGTTLSSTYYGPDVSTTYYLGYFIEDYGYSSSTGDLDEYNGRWCVTPEYPSGTYAYFVPTTSTGAVAFPYSLASYYYGTVATTSTSVNVPSAAKSYFSYSKK